VFLSHIVKIIVNKIHNVEKKASTSFTVGIPNTVEYIFVCLFLLWFHACNECWKIVCSHLLLQFIQLTFNGKCKELVGMENFQLLN
jgi:hypothetical protein